MEPDISLLRQTIQRSLALMDLNVDVVTTKWPEDPEMPALLNVGHIMCAWVEGGAYRVDRVRDTSDPSVGVTEWEPESWGAPQTARSKGFSDDILACEEIVRSVVDALFANAMETLRHEANEEQVIVVQGTLVVVERGEAGSEEVQEVVGRLSSTMRLVSRERVTVPVLFDGCSEITRLPFVRVHEVRD